MGRGKLFATVILVLLALVQTPASADQSEPSRGVEDHRAIVESLRSAVLGLDPMFERVYERAGPLGNISIDDQTQVGDLSGDGIGEVLIHRWSIGSDPTGTLFLLNGSYTATVLNGRTGAELWTYDSTFVDGFAGMIPFRVGAKGAPGTLLIESNAFSAAYTVSLTALNGDGNVVWTKLLPSTYNWYTGARFWFGAAAATDALVALERMETRPGGAEDLLVGQADYVLPPGSGQVGQTDALRINGADGEMHLIASESSTKKIPLLGAIGDVDGDGSDDVAFIGKREGEEGHLAAYNGRSGAPIWTTAIELRMWPWVHGIRDIVGDATSDLFIGYSTWNSDTFGVVDGSTGQVLWKRGGHWPHILGDVDGDGLLDIGAFSLGERDRFLAFGNDGRELYDVVHSVDTSDCDESFCFTFGFYLAAGDLDADGVRDRYVELSTSWNKERVTYFVTGATGQRLHEKTRARAISGTVDGHGADVAIVKKLKGSLSLTILDGVDLAPLWDTTISGSDVAFFASSFFPYGSVMSLNGDRCNDMLVSVKKGESLTILALDGRDGSTLWKSSVTSDQKTDVRSQARDSLPQGC